ncbi:MAG TPA: oxygen-independent coproporphyrinogen III oxidase [Candidatus Sumerlaeota bacterium]|nr:oxygen-independent coproporphyrinogen III oxidase [Candidatus Sumerlaeota bacterium]
MAVINETHRLRDLDRAFLERYNLVGPRYTSYPTAPHFHEGVDGAAFRNHLLALTPAQRRRPLSIYIHLPFCIEHCSFCACNVIISPKMEQVSEPYVRMLEREVELHAAVVDRDRPVIQFHWGGGTPTYLNVDQIRRVHAMVAGRFNLAADAEQSIEIHVSWTSDEQLRTLAALGFNRVSLGVQDFNPRTQEAIRRRQTYERTRQIILLARELGFRGINVDLVYGLPYQTPATFGETIERIIDLRPDRLAVYNFAYLPGRLAHQRSIRPETLPSGEQKFQIFLEAHDRFSAAGYRYIGMDHFALPDDELSLAFDQGTMQRNFMGFTTRAGADLLGIGVSAISHVTNCYAQNVKKPPAWERAIAAGEFPIERGLLLSRDDLIRQEVIAGLMCRDHVNQHEIERHHGIVFDEYFAEEIDRLEPMVRDELLTIGPDTLDLTFLGRLFVRNIAMVFDAYLKRPEGKQVVYSRTL